MHKYHFVSSFKSFTYVTNCVLLEALFFYGGMIQLVRDADYQALKTHTSLKNELTARGFTVHDDLTLSVDPPPSGYKSTDIREQCCRKPKIKQPDKKGGTHVK